MDMDFKVAEVELNYKPKCNKKARVRTSEEAYQLLLSLYNEDTFEYRESFKVLFLNNNANVIAYTTIAEGGLTCCPVDPRMILQAALLTNATKMILSHNHPSGSLTPSKEDDRLTNLVAEAGSILRINVLDHIILTKDGFYSYSAHDRL